MLPFESPGPGFESHCRRNSASLHRALLDMTYIMLKGLFYNPKSLPFGKMCSWINYCVYIALDKALFSTKKYLYFSYFSTKTYVVGTH